MNLQNYVLVSELARDGRQGVLLGEQLPRRRTRRSLMAKLGLAFTVGTISSIDQPASFVGVQGTAHKPNPLSGGGDIVVNLARNSVTVWDFGTGAGKYNQAVQLIFTVTKASAGPSPVITTLDLSGVLTNAVGDLLTTLSKVKLFCLEYLTVAQDATNGTAAAGAVTMAPGASSPVTTSPLGADQVLTLLPGSKLYWEDALNGFTVTSGSADKFDFSNLTDLVYDSHFRLTIWGEK